MVTRGLRIGLTRGATSLVTETPIPLKGANVHLSSFLGKEEQQRLEEQASAQGQRPGAPVAARTHPQTRP